MPIAPASSIAGSSNRMRQAPREVWRRGGSAIRAPSSTHPARGAASVVDHLSALVSERLIYVWCNPSTLARDLRRLTAHGFSVGAVQPIDLFAQTHHVETVVRLDRE